MQTFGIDISLWQKGIDFKKIKAEKVEFVIIKCSQADYKDPEFENHYKKARDNGLNVGAYHYMTASTVAEAKKEAKACIDAIKGKKFEYPIFLDFEGNDKKLLTKAQATKLIKTFCEALENAGYWVGFYCNYDFYKNVVNGEDLAKRFSFWCATWGTDCPVESAQMWQFGGETNYLRSNQIAGMTVDQNYAFKDFPSLIKEKGLNGYTKSVETYLRKFQFVNDN